MIQKATLRWEAQRIFCVQFSGIERWYDYRIYILLQGETPQGRRRGVQRISETEEQTKIQQLQRETNHSQIWKIKNKNEALFWSCESLQRSFIKEQGKCSISWGYVQVRIGFFSGRNGSAGLSKVPLDTWVTDDKEVRLSKSLVVFWRESRESLQHWRTARQVLSMNGTPAGTSGI